MTRCEDGPSADGELAGGQVGSGQDACRHALEEGGEIAFQERKTGAEVIEHGLTVIEVADRQGDVIARAAGQASDLLVAGR